MLALCHDFMLVCFQFLETMSDAIQKSIHEAEAVLQKESEEKFFEEVIYHCIDSIYEHLKFHLNELMTMHKRKYVKPWKSSVISTTGRFYKT